MVRSTLAALWLCKEKAERQSVLANLGITRMEVRGLVKRYMVPVVYDPDISEVDNLRMAAHARCRSQARREVLASRGLKWNTVAEEAHRVFGKAQFRDLVRARAHELLKADYDIVPVKKNPPRI